MVLTVIRLAALISASSLAYGFVSEPSLSTGPPSAPAARPKYLTYQPSDNGFGNRLQTFQIAFILALRSGRTLISRPFSDQHTNGVAVPYTTYLRPIDPKVLHVVEDFEVPDLHSLPTGFLRLNPWLDCNQDLDQIVTWIMQRKNDDVITYKYRYGHWEAMFRQEDVNAILPTMLKHVRVLPEIEGAARKLIHYVHGNYIGVHMRLGDKPGRALVNCTKRGLAFQPYGYYCDGPEISIEDAFAFSFAKRSFPKTVYVATNRPRSRRIGALALSASQKEKRMMLWESFPRELLRRLLAEDRERFLGAVRNADWARRKAGGERVLVQQQTVNTSTDMNAALLQTLANERSGTLIGLIEQQILIHAKTYLPSLLSSWDQYVITQRYHRSHHSEETTEQFMLLRDAIFRARCQGMGYNISDSRPSDDRPMNDSELEDDDEWGARDVSLIEGDEWWAGDVPLTLNNEDDNRA